MKSKELKTYNLPDGNLIKSSINAKPTWLFILMILLGLVALIMRMPLSYSLTLIVVGVVSIVFMPKVTLMEFYDNYFVMYNRADKSSCVLIYYDEVVSWHYSWGPTKDNLFIELENGTTEKINVFSKTIFETYMSKYMKDKRKKK